MAMPPPPPPPPPMSPYRIEEGGIPGRPPGGELSGFIVCMNVINTVTHLLLGSVAFSAFFLVSVSYWDTMFNAHVCLTVIGYVILMSQAVLAFNPYTGWANYLKYPQKRLAHWILQVFGSILALSGCAIGISNIPRFNLQHLQSAHGIVGFVAMLLTAVSLVGGIVHLLCHEKMSTVLMKTIHSCVGCLTITVAYIALCLAFDKTRNSYNSNNSYPNLSIALTVFALLGTLMMAFSNTVKRACK